MENKEQILKILKLVEDGKLTPEEAEEIITAMKEADAGPQRCRSNVLST